MTSIRINNTLVIDRSEFIRIYNENVPYFVIKNIRNSLVPRIVDDDYVVCLGYKVNVKSTVFKDAKSTDLIKGYNMVIKSIADEDILESFFELEIYNYELYLNKHDSYFFPSLELLKLCYWFHMCSQIPDSASKLLQIKTEILGKSRAINKYSKASESNIVYEDFLNGVSDLSSEMMLAALTHRNGRAVSLNKSNDFIIEHNIAEVKSLHDKFDREILDRDSGSLLKMSLPNNFGYNDLVDIICDQITREKWKHHLICALKKRPKLILFNVTQTQELQYASMFMEQEGLRKSFKDVIDISISLINNHDSIPVLTVLENISQYHVISFFYFLLPVNDKDTDCNLDLSRYNKAYFKDNISLVGSSL